MLVLQMTSNKTDRNYLCGGKNLGRCPGNGPGQEHRLAGCKERKVQNGEQKWLKSALCMGKSLGTWAGEEPLVAEEETLIAIILCSFPLQAYGISSH